MSMHSTKVGFYEVHNFAIERGNQIQPEKKNMCVENYILFVKCNNILEKSDLVTSVILIEKLLTGFMLGGKMETNLSMWPDVTIKSKPCNVK